MTKKPPASLPRLAPNHHVAALSAVALLVLTLAACQPTVNTRGNLLSASKVAQIVPEASDRADVQRVWGPPTTVAAFDDNTWYYIGETTSQKGVFEAEVQKRQILKVVFDENDLVTEIATLDETHARDVDFASRKTPTAGKEFTAVQQFIGNIGKFNRTGGGGGSGIPGGNP